MNMKLVGGAALGLATMLVLSSCGSDNGSGGGGNDTKASGGGQVTLKMVAADYGDGRAMMSRLASLAVHGEPLYLVRSPGRPASVFFACRTSGEAEVRSRKALRIPDIVRVDTLSV